MSEKKPFECSLDEFFIYAQCITEFIDSMEIPAERFSSFRVRFEGIRREGNNVHADLSFSQVPGSSGISWNVPMA